MSIILKYGAAAFVFLALLAASHYSAYQWGFNVAHTEQLQQANEQLAKSAQHIIDEQAKLQIVEDIITNSKDNTVIKSPILMQSLISVSKCSGKPTC